MSSPAAAVLVFSVGLEAADWSKGPPATSLSLLSLDSLPPEPEPEQASATNNVLYHGALIKQLTITTFTQIIFTQDELNHVLFLKLNLLQTDKRNGLELICLFGSSCVQNVQVCRNKLPLSVHSLIFSSFPRSSRSLPRLLTTSILLLSSSNFLPFLLALQGCPRPQIPGPC